MLERCILLHCKLQHNPDIISSSFELASPAMRGSTPLDVAAASVMDNNELALALREPDLEKVSHAPALSVFGMYLRLTSV